MPRQTPAVRTAYASLRAGVPAKTHLPKRTCQHMKILMKIIPK